jgi:uncharacterized protein YggE
MNFGSMRLYGGVSCMVLALGSAVLAQTNESVRGQGTATLVRPADHLHLDVQVKMRGKDVQEAFSKLKEFEADVQKKLTAVQDGKFVFDSSRIDADDDPQKNYMRMMQQMQNPNARKKPAAPTGVSASTTLHCDWELKGSSADDVSLAAYQLQEKIKATNAWKGAPGTDLKAQEEAEETDESQQMNFNGMPTKPGAPVFTFTATFPADEVSKGTAKAFEDAKTQATDLAKAVGKSLGDLREVDGAKNGVAVAPDNPMAQYIAMMQAASEQKPVSHEPNVVIGDQPGVVSMQIAVTARFQLK